MANLLLMHALIGKTLSRPLIPLEKVFVLDVLPDVPKGFGVAFYNCTVEK